MSRLTVKKGFVYNDRGFSKQSKTTWFILAEFLPVLEIILSLKRCTDVPIFVYIDADKCAEEIEEMIYSFVVQKATRTVRNMFPEKSKVVKFLFYKVTKWHSDPFSYGSNSFENVLTMPNNCAEMAKPVGYTLSNECGKERNNHFKDHHE